MRFSSWGDAILNLIMAKELLRQYSTDLTLNELKRIHSLLVSDGITKKHDHGPASQKKAGAWHTESESAQKQLFEAYVDAIYLHADGMHALQMGSNKRRNLLPLHYRIFLPRLHKLSP